MALTYNFLGLQPFLLALRLSELGLESKWSFCGGWFCHVSCRDGRIIAFFLILSSKRHERLGTGSRLPEPPGSAPCQQCGTCGLGLSLWPCEHITAASTSRVALSWNKVMHIGSPLWGALSVSHLPHCSTTGAWNGLFMSTDAVVFVTLIFLIFFGNFFV